AGGLLGVGGVLLHDLVHFRNGGVDLVNALGLLFRGRRDFGDQRRDLAGAVLDPAEVLGHFGRHIDSSLGVLLGALDQVGGVLGRFGAAPGQVAYFLGHHGESLAG